MSFKRSLNFVNLVSGYPIPNDMQITWNNELLEYNIMFGTIKENKSTCIQNAILCLKIWQLHPFNFLFASLKLDHW